MEALLKEDSERGKLLKKFNVAIDNNSSLATFLNYTQSDGLPIVFLFDNA